MKRIFDIILLCGLLLGICSCEGINLEDFLNQGKVVIPGQEEGEDSVTDIIGIFFPDTIYFFTRQSRVISPYIETRSRADRISLTWKSLDSTTASVNQEGLVTAHKSGSARISASATGKEEISDTCTIVIRKYDGNEEMPILYARLKDAPGQIGNHYYYDNHTYVYNYFILKEFKGDNVCFSGPTTDSFVDAVTYENRENNERVMSFWDVSYNIIELANTAIQVLDGSLESDKHFLGEAYFFRAFAHLNLVNMFAMPYSHGTDAPGVPLKLVGSVDKNASVGKVYDQVVEDLLNAIFYMQGRDLSGKDKGYITAVAAKALLARVYLEMEQNQKCAELCSSILGAYPASNLDQDLAAYPAHTKTSIETIWCIAHNYPQDNKYMGSIGSIYYSPDGPGNTGWAEAYWSDPLLDLIEQHPYDKRYQAYFYQYGSLGDGKVTLRWPAQKRDNYYINKLVHDISLPEPGNGIYFTIDGLSYVTEPEYVNGNIQHYITYNGERTRVRLCDNFKYLLGQRNSYPLFFMTKFSNQDGISNMSSPAILRWAEVILNRAEANAKLGNLQAALDDVNIIRTRAGLTEEDQMTLANYPERGYDSILEVVLDERRLELCFEGFRAYDLFRNKINLDRRYAGYNPWEIIRFDDPRIPFKVPEYLK